MPDNDSHDGDAPRLSDADNAEVRRLLREARADGSPPPEVINRLEDTLASLVAERNGWVSAPAQAHVPGPPPVVPGVGGVQSGQQPPSAAEDELAARRSRRRKVFAGVGLAAAATIVAAGFLGQMVLSDDKPDSASNSSEWAADESDDSAAQAPGDSAPEGEAPNEARPTEAPPDHQDEAPPLARSSLTTEQERAVQFALTELGARDEELLGSLDQDELSAANTTCANAVGSAEVAVLTLVNGEVRVLALDPVNDDGTREVRVVDCTLTPPEHVDTVRVPAP